MSRFSRDARQRGFALLAVLWILVGVSALALAMSLAGRDAITTAQNRLSGTRARWAAEACLERARAAMSEVLGGQAAWLATPPTWTTLDHAVLTSPYVTQAGCDLSFRSAGSALDINAADSAQLVSLFLAAGLRALTADSLADAILIWRAVGGTQRGADQAWYKANHRQPPRGGPFADSREVHGVRGFDEALAVIPALDTLLTAEPGRIVLDRAPRPVLASLPGMTDEAVGRLVERRSRGVTTADPLALASALSPAGRVALTSRYTDLLRLTASEPEAWILSARSSAGTAPAVKAVVEVRLVRAGDRAAIVRRRVWQ
jgi:general secretion pathway protein K